MRIKKLLPQQISEATKPDKSLVLYLLKKASELYKNCEKNSNLVNFKDLSDLTNGEFDSLKVILSDAAAMALVKTFLKYQESEKNDYVISPDFFRAFKKISLHKVQFKHLPRNTSGFVEFPESIKEEIFEGFQCKGDRIKGFFFSILKITDWYNVDSLSKLDPELYMEAGKAYEDCFALAWIAENESVSYTCQIICDDDIFIKDVLKSSDFNYIDRNKNIANFKKANAFTSTVSLMLNVIAYINSGDPDLRKFKNNVTYRTATSSKPVNKDRDLALNEVNLLGFGWKKTPLYQKEMWDVAPYWATRRYGPSRSLEKLVLVAGSTRSRKKQSEDRV